jgi:hypothetical protein
MKKQSAYRPRHWSHEPFAVNVVNASLLRNRFISAIAIVDDSMHVEAAQKLTAYASEEKARQSAQGAGAPLPATAGQLSVRDL